jgi:hypothetical protein
MDRPKQPTDESEDLAIHKWLERRKNDRESEEGNVGHRSCYSQDPLEVKKAEP